MSTGLAIALLIGLPAFFVLMLVFGSLHYKKSTGSRYKPLSYFPYEMFQEPNDPYLTFTRIFSGFFLVLLGLTSVYLLQLPIQPNSQTMIFVIIVAALGGVEMVLLFFLFILPVKYSKAHIYISVFYFCLSILYSAFAGIYLLDYAVGDPVGLVFGIICFVLALAVVLLVISPRFSYWAKLHVVEDKEGSPVVFRPRVFILAAGEWMVILANMLTSICLILALLLLSL